MTSLTTRLLITGAPGTGKSTLAAEIATTLGIATVRSTDAVSVGAADWSAASAEVVRWMEQPGPWIIEGCRVAHAARKWFTMHETAPAELLIVLYHRFIDPSRGQVTLGKQVARIIGDCVPDLQRTGVRIALNRDVAMAEVRKLQ
jgi:hypothetical protein